MKPLFVKILLVSVFFGLLLAYFWSNHSPKVASPKYLAQNPAKKILYGYLDINSQSNIDVIASGRNDEQPCPLELTNSLSNTNLFSADEQKFLKEIPFVYGGVASNSGPVGSVQTGLFQKGHFWDARFQFTNSDLVDEVVPRGDMLLHKVMDAKGKGFELRVWSGDQGKNADSRNLDFWLIQMKNGVPDGLNVLMDGTQCERWMRFSNGLAVDQWLIWDMNTGKLAIWVKFNEPYNYLEHSKTGLGS